MEILQVWILFLIRFNHQFKAIKAADQIFYKDRVHYVDFKPIFTFKKEGKIEGVVDADNKHKDNLTKPDKNSVGNVPGIFFKFWVIWWF